MFADMMRNIEEADLDANARAIVERNRVEMLAQGINPEADAEADDDDLSPWQALASCDKPSFSDVDGNAFGLQRKLIKKD